MKDVMPKLASGTKFTEFRVSLVAGSSFQGALDDTRGFGQIGVLASVTANYGVNTKVRAGFTHSIGRSSSES